MHCDYNDEAELDCNQCRKLFTFIKRRGVINSLTVWRLLLPYEYSYKAYLARPG